MFRFMMVVLAAASLAACATGPNPLTADARNGVFVRDVAVSWSVKDAKQASNAKYQAAKADMQKRLQSVIEARFKSSPSGSDPVTFKIDVTKYYGTGVVADVSVVRAANGQVLGVYKNVAGYHTNSGGLLGLVIEAAMKPDMVGIVSNAFADNLRARFNQS